MAQKKTVTAMKRAAIYARISQDRSDEALGVERQEKDCRELAKSRGWEVVGVYVDNNRSATSGKRPEYQRLVSDAQARLFDVVVVWRTDRLYRRLADLEMLVGALGDVPVHAVLGGHIDLSTADGRLTARVIGAAAQHEAEAKGERQRRKNQELVAQGKLTGGGLRPYGYRDDRVTIDKAEAKIVRECARRVLAGESLAAVARDLNDRGVPSVTGAGWTAQGLRYVLASGRIAGVRDHIPAGERRDRIRAQVVGPAVWKGIITVEQHEKLRAIFQARSRGPGHPPVGLLTGLLTCGVCASQLKCGSGHGRPLYKCKGYHVSIDRDAADEYVVALVREALASPAFVRMLTATPERDDSEVLEQIAKDETALAQLGNELDDGLIGRAEYLRRRGRIEARLQAARSDLGTSRSATALVGALGGSKAFDKAWAAMPGERRRALLEAVLSTVSVGEANGRGAWNDMTRLTPVWRACVAYDPHSCASRAVVTGS